jgi:hypothetical protein
VQPVLRVDDEHEQVRFGDCLEHLPLDLDIHGHTRIVGEAAGVHEPELPAVPVGAGEMTVARRSCLVAHDRAVLTDDAVEKG